MHLHFGRKPLAFGRGIDLPYTHEINKGTSPSTSTHRILPSNLRRFRSDTWVALPWHGPATYLYTDKVYSYTSKQLQGTKCRDVFEMVYHNHENRQTAAIIEVGCRNGFNPDTLEGSRIFPKDSFSRIPESRKNIKYEVSQFLEVVHDGAFPRTLILCG